jgi:flagella basal body P-ring formation protein FlgA
MIFSSSSGLANTRLRVTALESGAVGEVIRCRSTFDGVILLGRIVDAETVELAGQEKTKQW